MNGVSVKNYPSNFESITLLQFVFLLNIALIFALNCDSFIPKVKIENLLKFKDKNKIKISLNSKLSLFNCV